MCNKKQISSDFYCGKDNHFLVCYGWVGDVTSVGGAVVPDDNRNDTGPLR